MAIFTADLCDLYSHLENFQIAEPIFRQFGNIQQFSGKISTLKVFEDNTLIRIALEQEGKDRVLVVDGGGSKRCALLGHSLAELAVANGWTGIILYGCVRDSALLADLPLGIMALNTHPLPSRKHGGGNSDVLITFAGVNFKKNHSLYADCDGIIVSETKLD